MENVLYSINLVIHIMAAILCVAAPFYQLRWLKLGGNCMFGAIIHCWPDKNSLLGCGTNQKGEFK